MTTAALPGTPGPRPSPFAGIDVCRVAGLALPAGTPRPMFENDHWDFTHLIGLPKQVARFSRRFDFAAIIDSRWRLVAKELIVAMLAPRHDAVAPLPRAYRTPLRLNTATGRLSELTRFLNWLTGQGVANLSDVDNHCCQAYMAFRRYVHDDNGVVIGERSPAIRRAAAQIIVDLVNHRELLTADRVAAHLRPWGDANPSSIAETPVPGQNKTPPLADDVLQPMLAAAHYAVTTLGPRAVELTHHIRQADQRSSRKADRLRAIRRVPAIEISELLASHERTGEPLPALPEHYMRSRLATGWSPDDPLTPVALGTLARQAGFLQFKQDWLPRLRSQIETTLSLVGTAKAFGRDAVSIDRADAQGTVAWTVPLDRPQGVTALVGIVRTAAITLLAAVSGMRASELMELHIGSCRPPEHYGEGLVRYRLASKVIKGQPLGGTDDEWVVIEPAYRAVQLLEQLHDNPHDGAPLLGRFAFDVRYKLFRNGVNGPAGQRLGLAPIPETRVTLRALSRTLAIELAYRPGGVLAAKLHLKHIAVAATEGYASRPGGAQAELLAEVNKHEADRNLELLWAEFRNYQQGVMPAGPGARELTEFFNHIDGERDAADAASPKVQRNNREVLNLLTKRARTLHLGTANYCWFTDPSRALCLKLAGTPNADKPLAGMCDSARCPQATHHPCHRPVWAEHANNTKTFLGDLGPTRKTEKARLQAEYDRATRVLAEIDAADTTTTVEE